VLKKWGIQGGSGFWREGDEGTNWTCALEITLKMFWNCFKDYSGDCFKKY